MIYYGLLSVKWDIYVTPSPLKTQGLFQRRGWKGFKRPEAVDDYKETVSSAHNRSRKTCVD